MKYLGFCVAVFVFMFQMFLYLILIVCCILMMLSSDCSAQTLSSPKLLRQQPGLVGIVSWDSIIDDNLQAVVVEVIPIDSNGVEIDSAYVSHYFNNPAGFQQLELINKQIGFMYLSFPLGLYKMQAYSVGRNGMISETTYPFIFELVNEIPVDSVATVNSIVINISNIEGVQIFPPDSLYDDLKVMVGDSVLIEGILFEGTVK